MADERVLTPDIGAGHADKSDRFTYGGSAELARMGEVSLDGEMPIGLN